jgi:phage FluMu protein Com
MRCPKCAKAMIVVDEHAWMCPPCQVNRYAEPDVTPPAS